MTLLFGNMTHVGNALIKSLGVFHSDFLDDVTPLNDDLLTVCVLVCKIK